MCIVPTTVRCKGLGEGGREGGRGLVEADVQKKACKLSYLYNITIVMSLDPVYMRLLFWKILYSGI